MSLIEKQGFGNFKRLIERQYVPPEKEDWYRQTVGEFARKTRSAIFGGKPIEKTNELWKDWFGEVTIPDAIGDGGHVLSVANFNQETIKSLIKCATNIHYAYAFHYRLHSAELDADIERAEALDRELFCGQTFEEAFDTKVFAYEPDHLFDVPPPKPIGSLSYPDYVLRKQVEARLAKYSDDGVWLDPHNHYTIPLEGRETELDVLDRFVQSAKPFRILPVIAPSGAGKTRLISEWMKPYVATWNRNTKWDAGLVVSRGDNRARDPAPWREWLPERNTLIVIDYTYSFDEVVKAIYDQAKAHATEQKKVRLIVIDHQMPQFLWEKLEGRRQAALVALEEQTLVPALELKAAGKRSDMLAHVLAASASVGKEPEQRLAPDHPRIQTALRELDRMGADLGENDVVRHPLFAALMGQVIRNADSGPVDFSQWSRRDLISYYFQNPDRLPWELPDQTELSQKHSEKRQIGLYAGALISAATLRRGLMITEAEDHIPKTYRRQAFALAQRIVSENAQGRIREFLPDILGETFLLKFLETAEGEHEVLSVFFALLSESSADSEEGLAASFLETLDRLTRNLSGDDPSDPRILACWDVLPTLLNPQRFVRDTALRTSASYAISDVMQQLSCVIKRFEQDEKLEDGENSGLISLYRKRLAKLENRFELSEMKLAAQSDEFVEVASAVLSFFEYAALSEQDTRWKVLEEIAVLVEERPEGGLSLTHLASINGWTACLLHLHKYLGFDLDTTTEGGWTEALLASANGHLETLHHLHLAGVNLSATTEDGRNAAMLASAEGDLEVLIYLHEAGVDLNTTAEDGRTSAIAASEVGHLEVLRYLHEAGVDLNAATEDGETAALCASWNGHLETLRYLHEAGVDLNATAQDGVTAAVGASEDGHLEVLRYLHEAGVELSGRARDGRTPAMYACDNGHLEILRYLHWAGVDLSATTEDGQNAAMFASAEGDLEVLRYLHEAGVDLNATADDGGTAVHTAGASGHLETLRYLHQAGADLSASEENGWTAAMYASVNGHLEVLCYLHEAGVDLNATSENGITTAMLASSNGNLGIVRLLHEAKVDLNATASEGWTAVLAASQNGHLETLRYLHEAGVDLNVTTRDGWTAAMLASASDHLETLRYLHEAGVDLNVVSRDGWTAASAADHNGHFEVLEYLVSEGFEPRKNSASE